MPAMNDTSYCCPSVAFVVGMCFQLVTRKNNYSFSFVGRVLCRFLAYVPVSMYIV